MNSDLDPKNNIAKWEDLLQTIFKSELETAIYNKEMMTIDFWKLDQTNNTLSKNIIEHPILTLNYLQQSIKNLTENDGLPINLTFKKKPIHEIEITELRTKHLNKLHSIEGFIIQISRPYSKLVVGKFQCKRCGAIITVEQPIDTDMLYEPLECLEDQGGCGRPTSWELLDNISIYRDFQKILIQNPFHHQQRIELEAHLYDHHVGKITPGEWVTFNSVYMLKKQRKNIPEPYLLVRGIEQSHARTLDFTDEEYKKAIELSKKPDCFNILIENFAPSVYGTQLLKEACLLQLFDGVWYDLPDGTTRRGSIHLLLAGDPGTVKSVLKQGSSAVCPRFSSATGKGCTVAGIIAGSRKDKLGDREGWILDAGALVLANNGICYLDEFDKIPDEVHGALHGPMEQGIVETSKICAVNQRLPSRTSVFAAMNPERGRFKENEPFLPQLRLDSAILSRFDLIFAVLDKPDPEIDRNISLHMHKTMKGNVPDVEYSSDFLRKYIYHAKKINPIIPDDVYRLITDSFVACRNKIDKNGNYIENITFRQNETLRRLSQASARSRLSDTVSKDDVTRAWNIFKESLISLGVSDVDSISVGWSNEDRSIADEIKVMLPASYNALRNSGFFETQINNLVSKGLIREYNGSFYWNGSDLNG